MAYGWGRPTVNLSVMSDAEREVCLFYPGVDCTVLPEPQAIHSFVLGKHDEMEAALSITGLAMDFDSHARIESTA